VTAHNGTMRMLQCDWLGISCEEMDKVQHVKNVGVYVMDYDTDRAETAIQKLQSLVYETHGNAYLSVTENMGRVFREGKSAFFLWRFESVFEPAFREMEADFGIIPYPMLDEEQQEYETIIHNSSNSVTVPVTCRNPDEIGAVIEALCAESYRTVVEPFYETALKTKYTRDSFSAQCIDIIRNVAVKNFMYEYNGVVGGGRMIREQLQNNSNTFSSSYAAQVSVTNQKIRDMVDKFNKLSVTNEADIYMVKNIPNSRRIDTFKLVPWFKDAQSWLQQAINNMTDGLDQGDGMREAVAVANEKAADYWKDFDTKAKAYAAKYK